MCVAWGGVGVSFFLSVSVCVCVCVALGGVGVEDFFFIVIDSTHSLLLNDQHGLDSDNVGSASSLQFL